MIHLLSINPQSSGATDGAVLTLNPVHNIKTAAERGIKPNEQDRKPSISSIKINPRILAIAFILAFWVFFIIKALFNTSAPWTFRSRFRNSDKNDGEIWWRRSSSSF
ncbi:hypothetical protein JXM67_02165 [candidate division WOR-3 bacterium]|nr:hypothetical protein [candidate division WOR-3 bacterium]